MQTIHWSIYLPAKDSIQEQCEAVLYTHSVPLLMFRVHWRVTEQQTYLLTSKIPHIQSKLYSGYHEKHLLIGQINGYPSRLWVITEWPLKTEARTLCCWVGFIYRQQRAATALWHPFRGRANNWMTFMWQRKAEQLIVTESLKRQSQEGSSVAGCLEKDGSRRWCR